ncbi:MAG: leucyl aminopeptidase [Ilumatobacteraceae bacterium]|nr:leucyl aminopeptidase [Ilumatobacteraceae bacterium]
MTIQFSVSTSSRVQANAIGVPVGSDGPVSSKVGLNRKQLSERGFEGRVGQTLVLHGLGGASVVVAIGVGVGNSLTPNDARKAAAAFARAAGKVESLATTLAGVGRGNKANMAQAVVEGIQLATHRYSELKSDKNFASRLREVVLVATAENAAAISRGVKNGAVVANAVCMARDLANTPPAYLTARHFADKAVEIAAQTGLEVTVYNKEELIQMGCGGMIGVNQGSVEPPRMVKLSYNPKGAGKKQHVVLVGKGVMYDSGGISLKPSDPSHAVMKMDMSGAAAVLATMSTLGALKCATRVTAFLMCTDNMPSGSALKLGDVLTMRNGKTVEIHNTDAEGRLILADGLSLAAELKPSAIINIATLTGACLVALGEKVAGVLGTNDKLISQLEDAAARVDEPIWQLPLVKEYRRLLDSTVADMRNIGGPAGGTITAGLFLSEFVGNTPWAHLDIAGPMKVDGDDGWMQRGATAFGTRLLIETVTSFKAL